MLTLGLVEGVLSATLGILVLVGAANANAPLHRIFGPMVALVVGVAAYGVHDAGAMHEMSNVIGLGTFALLAFFAPLGVMRYAWKQMKALDQAPVKDRVAPPQAKLQSVTPEELPARKVA
jgi:hypothetical protein